MKTFDTSALTPNSIKSQTEKDWIYNGLDCCITAEVCSVLLDQLDDTTRVSYAFSRALQGPVLDMRLRGVRIDARRRSDAIDEHYDQMEQIEGQLEQIVREGIGMLGFNWQSNRDLHKLFYDELAIPPIKKFGKPTLNRDALERLQDYFITRQLIAHILLLRDLKKTIDVLKTEIDPDGRLRASYNIAGTSTGRFSSSFSEFGTGRNMQNIDPTLRSMFIADPGMKIGYFDAQQIQSRIVGALEWNHVNDGKYLDACESGDLHTTVSKLCEPHLPWTGVLHEDREIAERDYYRHYSLRKLCKSIGHGSNFVGGPGTLHRMYKVPEAAIAKFQLSYFKAFPGHKLWHEWVEHELKTTGIVHSITQGRRQFWRRRDDHATLREAIAYDPQHSEAWIVNNGMLRVWRAGIVQLLMQGHDAIVVQYPEKREDEIVPQVFKLLEVPVQLKRGRTLLVPYGCETGWNWGKFSKDNPDGLKEYEPGDKRKRQKEISILDRPIRGVHRRA